MNRVAIAMALFGAACAGLGVLSADEPKKDAPKPDRKDVAKMMRAVHKGETAPYTRVKAELGKDAPDWAQMAKDVKSFDEMAGMLKAGGGGDYTSPKGYIDATTALQKAVADKDRKVAVDAFARLTASCGSCHYGGARAMLGKQ